MSKTDGEKREYKRGYSRAIHKSGSRLRAVMGLARAYRDRLTDYDTERRCHSCRRWTRGGKGCVWGFCAANFERPAEPSMWADPNRNCQCIQRIITTEDFGCVNWLPVSRERG